MTNPRIQKIEEVFENHLSYGYKLVKVRETDNTVEYLIFDKETGETKIEFEIAYDKKYCIFKVISVDTMFFANNICTKQWLNFMEEIEDRKN